MADLFFNGYQCNTCLRPGVRTSRFDVALGDVVDRCSIGTCTGALIRVPLEDAERALLEALRENGTIKGGTLDDGSLNRASRREPEPI